MSNTQITLNFQANSAQLNAAIHEMHGNVLPKSIEINTQGTNGTFAVIS